jgi:hypothetical protein
MPPNGTVSFTLGDHVDLDAYRAQSLTVLLASRGNEAAASAARKILAQVEADPALRTTIELEPDERVELLSVVDEVNPIRSVEALEPLHRALEP